MANIISSVYKKFLALSVSTFFKVWLSLCKSSLADVGSFIVYKPAKMTPASPNVLGNKNIGRHLMVEGQTKSFLALVSLFNYSLASAVSGSSGIN